MKFRFTPRVCTLLLLSLVLGCGLTAQAAVRTQTIQLKSGWNAVFLQVDPIQKDPAQLFAQLPVSVVASFFAKDRAVEFISDPNTTQWKKDGWNVWYAPGQQNSFLTTLYGINGNRGYLIFAEQDAVWNVEGEVAFEPVRWKSSSFNLVGFGLDSVAPPSFARFFKGSAAHTNLKAYRLVGDRWVLVQNPATEQMRDGEAYWIYSAGGSDFQGPVSIKLPFGRSIYFGEETPSMDIIFKSGTVDPVNISVTPPGDSVVPLGMLQRALSPGEIQQLATPLAGPFTLPTLEARDKAALKLELRREKMTALNQDGLLKITTDVGTVVWLSISSKRREVTVIP